MQALVCEMCGSIDLVKDKGLFICQSCGCKYTSVKIDESEKVSNWFKMAEAAFENCNWDEAYTYYCKLLEVNPDDWISTYKKGLCVGWKSTLLNIRASEVLGGVADARIHLIKDDSLNDIEKANGIIKMASQLHEWISVINDMNIKHTNEFSGSLVSVCYDFFDRTTLISSMMVFEIGLFDEYVVTNVEDINDTETLLNLVLETAERICYELSRTFRPKTGQKWNTFWEEYDDVYETVSPTYTAQTASSELKSVVDDASFNFKQYVEVRIQKQKNANFSSYMIEHPEVFSTFHSKEIELAVALAELEKAKQEVINAQNEASPLMEECGCLESDISENEAEIYRLRKKIFGKHRAIEEAEHLESINSEKRAHLLLIEPKKNRLVGIVVSTQRELEEKQKVVDRINDEIRAIREIAES